MRSSDGVLDVGLYLRGDELDPDAVTALLGINASKARIKGETRHTPTGQQITAKTGVWYLDLNTESGALRDRLALLKRKLGSFGDKLTNIPGVQTAEISVFIALPRNGRGGGDYEFFLTSEDMASVSSLGIPLTFEITYVAE